MTRADLPGDDLVGRRIADRYRLDELIARGGMALVFRAHDERLARDVAVKVLAEPYASDAAFAERFLAEARTAAGLAHTNLVHVYDSGGDGEIHYIVMELLARYRTLHDRLAEDGPLPPAEAAWVVAGVLAGLGLVHERGFVHCDVKSANVMVGPGPVKLIDFGIARTPAGSGHDGRSLGSLHAMPPEQLRNEPLRAASDLFATGVVLYEALTGRTPWQATDATGMLAAQATPPPRPSELVARLPRRLDEVVAQSLRIDPDQRFHSARAMATALELAAASDPVAAPTDETREIDLSAADRGYVPPLLMPHAPPRIAATPQRPRPRPATRRGGSGTGAWLLTLLAVGAGALVVWLVLNAGAGLPIGPGAGGSASQPPGEATPSLPAGMVRVPNMIGLTEDQAEAAAEAAGLDWRINWREVAGETPGIYDQEPPAGEPVAIGSRIVMYAYRAPN